MAKKTNPYQRLPGGSGFFVVGATSRLYLADDHLLRVNSSGWSEKYRRFYFNDIQALNISLNTGQKFWVAIHITICALFLLWLLAIDSTGWRIFVGCCALFFAVKAVIHLARGPMCMTQIRTRIGAEPLPSLKRWKKASQVLELLRPRIQAAQGALNPADVPQRLADAGSRAVFRQSVPVTPFARAAAVPTPQENNYRGGLHAWTFSVFLVDAAVQALRVFSPGVLAALLVTCATLAAAGLTVVALVKQARSSLSVSLRIVTWLALGLVVISFVSGYALMIATIVDNPKISNDQGALFIAMSQMHTPWVNGLCAFMAAYALLVALAGFIALLGSRASANAAAEASSQP